MGVYIHYRTIDPLDATRAAAIRAAARKFDSGLSWLYCDSVCFDDYPSDNRLTGSSKLNLQPHPDDRAAATASGLPDGNVRNLFEALCEISRVHLVDWEVSHEFSSEPLGFILGGVIDDDLILAADGFEEASAYLAEDFESDFSAFDASFDPDEQFDDEDDN
ncbi:MAG: hypothetical protein WD845_05705 [Pirellulales bacterium]